MFFFPETLLTTIKEQQTITTHNTNRHCRVRFYACGVTYVETVVIAISSFTWRLVV